jgi:hypothetical protein
MQFFHQFLYPTHTGAPARDYLFGWSAPQTERKSKLQYRYTNRLVTGCVCPESDIKLGSMTYLLSMLYGLSFHPKIHALALLSHRRCHRFSGCMTGLPRLHLALPWCHVSTFQQCGYKLVATFPFSPFELGTQASE